LSAAGGHGSRSISPRAAEIAKQPAVGPGLIHRLIRETQRQFFDPPLSTASKYD
jgi:hypothetical protein